MPSYPHRFQIILPASLAEASAALLSLEEATLLAGGTELLLAMKQGALRYDTLVDLKSVPGLGAVVETRDGIEVGCLASHRVIATSAVVRAAQPALARLEGRIANARVRATGTLGGNLCFAEPNSDPATLLQVLNAVAIVARDSGDRELPIGEFIVGPYETALERGEILRALRVPALSERDRVGYHKVQLHERPMLGLALRLTLDDSGTRIVAAAAAVGAASPTSRRSAEAESLITGDRATLADRLDNAADCLAEAAELGDDHEGSADYKAHLIHVHLRRLVVELLDGAAAGPVQRTRPLRELVADWRAQQKHEPKPGFAVVGHSVPRTDGRAKVTGQAIYTGDVDLPAMTHAKVLRSPFAHARIRAIDTSAAERVPGVIAVLTGGDLAALPSPRYGHAIRDHWVLATEKVRFVGEPVAAVVAEEPHIAQAATELIEVDYEELDPVLTAEEALARGAPLVHQEAREHGASPGHVNLDLPTVPTNLLTHDHVGWGDIDAALSDAAVIVEGTYYYPMAFAYPLEAYVAVADFREDQLTVHTCGQHTYMVRRDLAEMFGLPLSGVRVITPYVGGGFGSKSYTKVEPLAAACAWKAGRPVRLELTIDETILTTRSDDSLIWLRTAADTDGRLIARQGRAILNSGAYAENSMLVSAKTASRLVGPFQFEAVDIDSRAAYTNTAPASSYRGFGGFHATLASEIQMDELAERLGIDPVELRMRNLVESGTTFFPGKRGLTADARGDLVLVAKALDWGRERPRGRGVGLALNAVDAGAAPVGRGEVRLHGDGSVTVLSGSAELGQGSKTVLGQIAAEAFGVTLDKVRVVQSDTALTPFARSTGADRTTTMEGTTLLLAAQDVKEQLRVMAAEIFEVNEEQVELLSDGVRHAERSMGWGEVIRRYFRLADMEVQGRGQIRQTGDWALLPPFWELPLAGVEAQVDEETGDWRLVRLVTLGDVGLAINPAMAEGQDFGSAMMGLGVATREELIYDGQQLANGSILGYRVPGFADLPDHVTSILVENQDGIGPFGAKGHGDGSLSSMAAAISNALHSAVGVRLHRPPFTPERVWQALQQQRQKEDGGAERELVRSGHQGAFDDDALRR